MTKAEAIAMLKRIQEPEAWEPQITQAAFEALDMAIKALERQSDGWLARHRDEILKAGMEGREFVFRIDGRLFAIREKAQ